MTGNPADRAGAILEIDLAGIAANWRFLARRVEPAGCAAVVKADAYGLGAPLVAPALAAAGCQRFFVATIDEGIALRRILPESAEIAVLNGLLPGCAADFIEFRLIPVLNDPGQIADWRSAASRHGKGPAILHVDTGMARLGLTIPEFDRLADELCHARFDPMARSHQPSRLFGRIRASAQSAPTRALCCCARASPSPAGQPRRVIRHFPRA